MLEIIKNRFSRILLLFLILGVTTFAQDINKKINDSKNDDVILFGKITPEVFSDEDFSYWYQPEFDEYIVDSITISKVSHLINEINFTVILGTWCDDSHREVPRLIKILKYAGFNFDKLNLFAVDHDKKAGIENFEAYNVTFVPTIILFDKDEEIGRIIESPEASLEKDIVKILSADGL